MMVHVVTFQLVYILADGTITPTHSNLTIGQVCHYKEEHRIAYDIDSPNSEGWPTLKQYLQAEAAAGFGLVHLDQYLIITQSA